MGYEKSAAYIVDIEEWRAQQEADLRAPDSWLSLTGLFVLDEGIHSMGSNFESDILLPAGAPEYLGFIKFFGGKTRLNVTSTVNVFVDGQPLREADLVDSGDHKQPTLVTVGNITFFVHKFGNLYAIRVKDHANPAIQAFTGREWFAIKPEYRVHGRFTPHDAPRSIPIKTIVDTNTKYQSVGTIDFSLQGKQLSLLATDRGLPNQLHVIFRDATSGVETYGPARFLTVEVDSDGRAIIDFNKANNPPCAFSRYATCPLPPLENILPVAIEAGERFSHKKVLAHTESVLDKATV